MSARHHRLLLDTSIYIRYLRDGVPAWVADDHAIVERCVLTWVVAAELYAGTRNADEKRWIDDLCRWHQALGTLSHPGPKSWLEAGLLIGRYRRIYGDLRMADHFRDLLIALEASRHDATFFTENTDDFVRWRKLFRSTGRTLKLGNLQEMSD